MELSPNAQARIEQIAKLPRPVRIGLLVGLAALLGGGYYLVSYQTASGELDRLRAQELELQRKLSEVRAVASNISAFEEEIAELEMKLQVALRQLPNEKQLEVLLTDISNLGKTAGVEIKSFRRSNERVHDFYAEVPLDLVLEGEYHDIARFFELLSKLPRIVNMGAINMSVGSATTEETRLKVTGTATTFRFVGTSA